jgi:hypothetical protein
MTGGKRVVAWTFAIVGGAAVIFLGVLFVATGLDTADKLASVIGAFAGLMGLGLAAYGVVLSRRGSASPPVPGGQRLDHVDAGQGVDVVDDVAGNVRLGAAASQPPQVPQAPPKSQETPRPVSPESASPTPQPPSVAGEQSLTDVRATGAIRVIRGVGGDVDITP